MDGLKGNFELLNCDDHLYLHKKLNKNPTDSRPDVLHQCLLALIDSPLNKAGHLQVYVRSNQNVLFEISPATRIPRTFKRFSGLMGTFASLLQRVSLFTWYAYSSTDPQDENQSCEWKHNAVESNQESDHKASPSQRLDFRHVGDWRAG